jgi:hypothetical protein
MNKKALFLALLFLCALSAPALDLGLTAGSVSRPSSFFYGLSAGSGTIVPMLKFEFEGWRISETGINCLSAALKLRPKFGAFAPYAVLGAGAEFEKLNFKFSEYNFYTFIGGGSHFFLNSTISLRADVRWLNLAETGKTRISGGLFIHL